MVGPPIRSSQLNLKPMWASSVSQYWALRVKAVRCRLRTQLGLFVSSGVTRRSGTGEMMGPKLEYSGARGLNSASIRIEASSVDEYIAQLAECDPHGAAA